MHYMENQKTSLKFLMVGMGAIGEIAARLLKKPVMRFKPYVNMMNSNHN